MVPGAPKNYCLRCDSPIPMDAAHCPSCGQKSARPWSDLRLTPQELAAAPSPAARASRADWGRSDKLAPSATASSQAPRLPQVAPALPAEPEPSPVDSAPPEPSVGAPTVDHGGKATVRLQDPEVEDALDDDSDGDDPPATTVRPPVLASDALQRELFPLEPGKISIRWVATLFGIIGVTGTLMLLGLSPGGVPISSGFAALTTLGVVPMAYLARAAALWLFAALGMFAANLIHFSGSHDGGPLGLLTAVVLLGQGLHFRAWHRASRAARALVALGIITGIAWLAAMGSIADLSVLTGGWREWGPLVMEVPFGILLMLSLLSFMDARTTAGCGAWAAGLWVWYAAYLVLVAATEALPPQTWPLRYQADLKDTTAVVQLANGLLAPMLGLATAQLLAGSLGVAQANRREPSAFNHSRQPSLGQTDL